MCDGGDTVVVRRCERRQRSIYQVHYALPPRAPAMQPLEPPTRACAYQQQVAGHALVGDKYLGLLQTADGKILKPIIKKSQKREVDFYTRVFTTEEPDLVELRNYVPRYYGCTKYTYNGHEQEYIVMEHLTEKMLEPCIMDVKIGKRTWDPHATPMKIKNEQTKYASCKEQFGFCIPGYQIYKLDSGKLLKYNKEHGKKLHGHLVRDAIRNYLNGCGNKLCRDLILQFLSALWKLQKWSGRPRNLRLYSASLLLVYDAARVRDCCGLTDPAFSSRPKCEAAPASPRRRHTISASNASGSNFSGLITSKGPVYKKVNPVSIAPLQDLQNSFKPLPSINSTWSEALEKINLIHSFDHNYENKLSKIKMNYRALLDQLSSDGPQSNPWGTVKIIDFAHAYFNDDEELSIDDNFKVGIDNFVDIVESLLGETDEVF